MHSPPPFPGRVLLLGASGMLGRAWSAALASHGVRFDAPSRATVDLARPDTLAAALPRAGGYQTALNCAAWTDVDGAESHETDAATANADGVWALAQACAAAGTKLVQYSTDYVFNGAACSPYRPDAPRDPIGAYGRTKANGERALEASNARWLCVRTSWVYAPWGKNFPLTIRRLGREKASLRVVDDQTGVPTSAQGLVQTSTSLLAHDAEGMFHATDGGASCTWFDVANEVVRVDGSGCTIERCSTDAFPRPAPRPAYSVLDVTATESLLGPLPGWRTNLAAVLAAAPNKASHPAGVPPQHPTN